MKTNYPANRKPATIKPKKKDPWEGVTVVRGKLSGGILTDKMVSSIFPEGYVKNRHGGLTPIPSKPANGSKTPIRPH